MQLPQHQVLEFIKKSFSMIDELSAKLDAANKEIVKYKNQIKKEAETRVILEKVAKENKLTLSEESLIKFANILNTNSSLDENKVSSITEKVRENPNLLVDVIESVLKSASEQTYQDGRLVNFKNTNSKTSLDKIWEEAVKP